MGWALDSFYYDIFVAFLLVQLAPGLSFGLTLDVCLGLRYDADIDDSARTGLRAGLHKTVDLSLDIGYFVVDLG